MVRSVLFLTGLFLAVPSTTAPSGTVVRCDLPQPLRMRNVGGRDGAGLCVFTSAEHSGRYQNVRLLFGFQQKMRAEKGGGWPDKLDSMLLKYAPDVLYVQHVGGDAAFLETCLLTGRMPCVTYAGRDTNYGPNKTIAHMVNLIYLDDEYAAILDNNFPDKPVWMTRPEFLDRWRDERVGGGWAVALLAPPPPFPVEPEQ